MCWEDRDDIVRRVTHGGDRGPRFRLRGQAALKARGCTSSRRHQNCFPLENPEIRTAGAAPEDAPDDTTGVCYCSISTRYK